ncbi:MAG: efflux transporter outer membrane subunit [Chlamydiota bacterium]
MKRLLLCLILGGCMVGPNYKPPENTVSDQWKSLSNTSFAEEQPLTDWWKHFEDPLLDTYMEMAALHNKEILVAEANILQARALRMVAASSFYPQIESNINGTKTYFSKNGPVFAGNSLTQGPSATTGLPFQIQIPQIQPLYNALIDASWEIDLFGKTRRTVQMANANYESTIETRNDILVSILAEIAMNYMELRKSQKNAELIQNKITLTEKEEKLSRKRFKKGFTNKIDLETIQAKLASIQAELPNVTAEIYRSIYTLSVLTGNPPETLVEQLLQANPLPKPPKTIAIGIRSDLLRRRPDIRRTERQLAMATANVGVAVASFFPSVVLSADAGLQSLKLSNLFNMQSKTWDFGGNIGIPIFQGGSLVGNLRSAEAATNAAAYTYQETILKALQETETALIAYSEDQKKERDLFHNTEHLRTIKELTNKRYKKGLSNLLDLIEAERALILSEQNLLTSELRTLLDLITLYKALGGGWQPDNMLQTL